MSCATSKRCAKIWPGCTVLLKKDGSFPLEKPCTLAAYGSGVRARSGAAPAPVR